MTFLELCQKWRQESGVGGSGPVAVTGQVGIILKGVDWVNDSWTDIQKRRPKWNFQRQAFSFETVADIAEYTKAQLGTADLKDLDTKSVKQYLKSDGVSNEVRLLPLPYEEWDKLYNIGTLASDVPRNVTQSLDRTLILNPPPNDVYVVSGVYYRAPTKLVGNDDTPRLPDEFHDLIWMGAVLKYAVDQQDDYLVGRFTQRYSDMMFELEYDQKPRIGFGAGALA